MRSIVSERTLASTQARSRQCSTYSLANTQGSPDGCSLQGGSRPCLPPGLCVCECVFCHPRSTQLTHSQSVHTASAPTIAQSLSFPSDPTYWQPSQSLQAAGCSSPDAPTASAAAAASLAGNSRRSRPALRLPIVGSFRSPTSLECCLIATSLLHSHHFSRIVTITTGACAIAIATSRRLLCAALTTAPVPIRMQAASLSSCSSNARLQLLLTTQLGSQAAHTHTKRS